jgi:hypothetical protein
VRKLAVWLGLAAATSALAAGPGPEVSRSRGRKDGIVVLFPRIVPETQDATVVALAERLQTRLQQIAVTSVAPTRVDVRPSPERVCPLAGCRATSVGVMLGHQDGGCAALALVGPPGEEPVRLVPLAGKFAMDSASLDFRAAPEGKVVVSEFVPCAQLEQSLDGQALARLFGAPAAEAGAEPAPAAPVPAPADPAPTP